MAIFGVAYSPLRVSVGMQVTEGVLTQEYDPGSSEYMPDRRIRPTAVLPVVRVSDPSGFLEDGVANTLLADIFWYEGEASEANVILDSNPDYDIDKTSDNTNRGRITVYKNVPFNRPLTLVFKAVLVDMAGGKVRRKANVMGSVNLTTSTASTAPLVLVRGYPRGNLYNIMDKRDLKLSAKLMAGTEEVPSAFWWYKKEGTKLTPLEDLEGAKTGELTVPVDNIGRKAKYVVKAQDCRKDLKAVQDAWLDAELEKIREWPRNLIAKQYMMDWNEVKAGMTEKGEDADGEYLRVIWYNLNDYVNNKYGDMFMGKADYQPGTRYVLRVRWKVVSGTGIPMFTFKYSDGTRDEYVARIPAGVTTVYESTFTTSAGKTVSGILALYDTMVTVNVYEISLTEYGGAENLIERTEPMQNVQYETAEKQEETLHGENVWKVTKLDTGKPPMMRAGYKLEEGKTYTASVYVRTGEVSGSDMGSIVLYDVDSRNSLASSMLTKASPGWTQLSVTLTPEKDYPNGAVYVYAGKEVGCETYFSCLKLEEGDTATEGYVPKWIPAAADLAVEAEGQSLPAGYRPSTQGDTHDGEYDLAVKMPKVATKVVTPWGDDKEVIMIPPGVKLFPARIQVDTPAGTLDNPELYFSADWGNGMKGMQVLLDAEQIGTGTMVVEPDIYDDLSKARYGACGMTGDAAKLENVESGMKLILEFNVPDTFIEQSAFTVQTGPNGILSGVVNGSLSLSLRNIGNSKTTTIHIQTGMIYRLEVVYNENPENAVVNLNGVKQDVKFSNLNDDDNSMLSFTNNLFYTLIEIWSPDGILLHKWDMEGATDDERLADKAVTENPINLKKESWFKLTPI